MKVRLNPFHKIKLDIIIFKKIKMKATQVKGINMIQ